MYESVQLKNVPEGKHHDLYDRNDTSREEVWGWLKQSDYQATLICLVFVQCLWKNFC